MTVAAILGELRDSTVLIIAVLTFIALMVYRRPLGEAISRLSHLRVRRGETEVTAATDGVSPATEDVPSAEQSPDDPSAQGTLLSQEETEHKDEKSDDPSALRDEMLSLLFDRRENEAKEVFSRLLAHEPDARNRKVDQVRWEAVRFMTGLAGSDALESLRRMAEDDEIKSDALFFIGNCLVHVGQLTEAIDAYLQSAESATTAQSQAASLGLAASTQVKAGRSDDAIALLKGAIRDATHDDALYGLWSALADVYDNLDDQEVRAIALQKAVELRPNATTVRFRTAWAYSEADAALAPLVAHHYDALLGISPDYAIARNNFGVQLERLEMPLHAVELYESAAERNNTLSMANLAYQFMGAGFGKQASAMLEKAASQPEPHKNVAKATADLAGRKATEGEKKRKLLAMGQQFAEFIREYGAAMIQEPLPLQGGAWVWDDGKQAELSEPSNHQLKVTWKSGTTDYELIADIRGQTARGQFRKQAGQDRWMSKQAEAFVIMVPSENSMRIARIDSDEITVLHCTLAVAQ